MKAVVGRLGREARLRALVAMVAIAAVVAVSLPSTERIGDRLQYALPVLGLGCAVVGGSWVPYLGRFVVLEAGIHIPKRALGGAAINRRPDGKKQGFPSGHTAAAAFGATALVACLKGVPAAQGVAVLAAGFTGGSRIEAERHTLWQVLAGAVLGWTVQAAGLGWLRRRRAS